MLPKPHVENWTLKILGFLSSSYIFILVVSFAFQYVGYFLRDSFQSFVVSFQPTNNLILQPYFRKRESGNRFHIYHLG